MPRLFRHWKLLGATAADGLDYAFLQTSWQGPHLKSGGYSKGYLFWITIAELCVKGTLRAALRFIVESGRQIQVESIALLAIASILLGLF